MKICDFNRQFLSFSYLFYFAQNDTKNMSLIFMNMQKLKINEIVLKKSKPCDGWVGKKIVSQKVGYIGIFLLFKISFSSVPTPGINNEHSLIQDGKKSSPIRCLFF